MTPANLSPPSLTLLQQLNNQDLKVESGTSPWSASPAEKTESENPGKHRRWRADTWLLLLPPATAPSQGTYAKGFPTNRAAKTAVLLPPRQCHCQRFSGVLFVGLDGLDARLLLLLLLLHTHFVLQLSYSFLHFDFLHGQSFFSHYCTAKELLEKRQAPPTLPTRPCLRLLSFSTERRTSTSPPYW